ncbi:MAG: hypothetical protein FWB71_04490 [Defluviitaleaceae bacterium]|nr:hypothetical protein [Defluviitaleaceae bacterium]
MHEDKDKIYWHDAFYAAIQLELHDYEDVLIFESEYQLSQEALSMDMLVIKKSADAVIDKNIGRIFLGHNIFEYKSEKDNLSAWDYNKAMGYAMIYSAFERVAIGDITVSFVVTPKPAKLFDYLAKARGREIIEAQPGIYHILGEPLPIQIIESKKLGADENVFLRNLRSNLGQKDLTQVLDAYKKYDKIEKTAIYLNRILGANKFILEEVMAMFDADVQEIVIRHVRKRGLEEKYFGDLIERWKQQGMQQGMQQGIEQGVERGKENKARDIALEMLNDGFGLEKIAHYVKMPLAWVENLESSRDIIAL